MINFQRKSQLWLICFSFRCRSVLSWCCCVLTHPIWFGLVLCWFQKPTRWITEHGGDQTRMFETRNERSRSAWTCCSSLCFGWIIELLISAVSIATKSVYQAGRCLEGQWVHVCADALGDSWVLLHNHSLIETGREWYLWTYTLNVWIVESDLQMITVKYCIKKKSIFFPFPLWVIIYFPILETEVTSHCV